MGGEVQGSYHETHRSHLAVHCREAGGKNSGLLRATLMSHKLMRAGVSEAARLWE